MLGDHQHHHLHHHYHCQWKDIPLENRSCWVCGDGRLEDEVHFTLFCEAYQKTRTEYLQCIIDETDLNVTGSEYDILSTLFHKQALHITGRYLEKMWGERRDILYERLEVGELE